jgi:hypothetical protein
LIRSTLTGMSDSRIRYSKTITESQNDNFYLGLFEPLKDSILLGDIKIKTQEIWYEKSWHIKHNFFTNNEIKIPADKGVNIIVPFDVQIAKNKKIDLCVKEYSYGCFNCSSGKNESGFFYLYYTSEKTDTLTLLFETEFGLGIKDTIKYKKK